VIASRGARLRLQERIVGDMEGHDPNRSQGNGHEQRLVTLNGMRQSNELVVACG
jgi:hypothetical protein